MKIPSSCADPLTHPTLTRPTFEAALTKAQTQFEGVGVHCLAGMGRSVVTSTLLSTLKKGQNPYLDRALSHLAKTVGLSSQIWILAPDRIKPVMLLSLGLGGAVSESMASLCRILGQIHFIRNCLTLMQGDRRIMACMAASILGVYTGQLISKKIQGQLSWSAFKAKTKPNTETPADGSKRSKPNRFISGLKRVAKTLGRWDGLLSKKLDQYVNLNSALQYLGMKRLVPEPLMGAKVILGSPHEPD